jgi:hypothetical protein
MLTEDAAVVFFLVYEDSRSMLFTETLIRADCLPETSARGHHACSDRLSYFRLQLLVSKTSYHNRRQPAMDDQVGSGQSTSQCTALLKWRVNAHSNPSTFVLHCQARQVPLTLLGNADALQTMHIKRSCW